MTATLLFAVFLLLMLAGIPVVAALAASSAVALFLLAGVPAVSLTQTAVFGVDKFVLLSIPLFILTGELMNASGISKRLFDLASFTSPTSGRAGAHRGARRRRTGWSGSAVRPTP